MGEFTELEIAVLHAVRDGGEPEEIRAEVEAVLLLSWNMKLALDGTWKGRYARARPLLEGETPDG